MDCTRILTQMRTIRSATHAKGTSRGSCLLVFLMLSTARKLATREKQP